MTSPFKFDVSDLLNGTESAEYLEKTGPSPARIGAEMIAIPEGGEVRVKATLTPLGGAVMADADIDAVLSGECVRCLADMHPHHTFHVSGVFSENPDFISGDEAEDEEAEGVGSVHDGYIDLLQLVIDEACLDLPFNPQCMGGCVNSDEVPDPDGVSGEDEDKLMDPRWAGLEKFL